MAESQIVRKVTPRVKVSSMDGHRMLTHPQQAPTRPGRQPPLRNLSGGQPSQHQAQDVTFKPQPIDITMQAGGVLVKRPPTLEEHALRSGTRSIREGAPIELGEIGDAQRTLSPAEASLCIDALETQLQQIGNVENLSEHEHKQIALARSAVAKLYTIASFGTVGG